MNRLKYFLKTMRVSNYIIALIFFSAFGCDPKNELSSLAEEEISSGVVQDSLFLGLYFGIDKQAFYDHCWKINREGIVTHGTENMSVLYALKDLNDVDISFNFYPEFLDNKTHKYRATFHYVSWAPWNKELQSGYLLKVLPAILEGWYGGNKFIKIKDKKGPHYYKIDGNRQIDLYMKDDRLVVANFTDLKKYPFKLEGL
jgi:hypothetical protein|tara:strand:+ start:52478 stop:53077 length:600 start_codon:yes stop_codon:yes gene_type:complete